MAWDSLCRPEWPWAHKYLLASASWVLGLKVWGTTSGQSLDRTKVLAHCWNFSIFWVSLVNIQMRKAWVLLGCLVSLRSQRILGIPSLLPVGRKSDLWNPPPPWVPVTVGLKSSEHDGWVLGLKSLKCSPCFFKKCNYGISSLSYVLTKVYKSLDSFLQASGLFLVLFPQKGMEG